MCFLLLWILLFLTELSVKDCCVIEVEAVTSLLEVLLRFSKLYILRKKVLIFPHDNRDCEWHYMPRNGQTASRGNLSYFEDQSL